MKAPDTMTLAPALLTKQDFDAIEAAIEAKIAAFVERHGCSGPRCDWYDEVLTADQRAAVATHWKTLPGNTSWLHAYDSLRRRAV